MKALACVLSLALTGVVSFFIGSTHGTELARSTIAKNCEKLEGFTVKARTYDCARKAKK